MAAKLRSDATRMGLTAIELAQRVRRAEGDGLGPIDPATPYGEKPLGRIGL